MSKLQGSKLQGSKLQGSIKLSELSALSKEAREEKLSALVQAAMNPTEDQVREQIDALNAQLTEFECRYEMSSVTMHNRLAKGEIKETADICSWMLLIKARDSFEPESTPAPTH
jgi:hypothetical protein